MASEGIRVLGQVEVVGDGGPVALTSKQRCLLAALVVADGRSCDVDELVEALWGASPPSSAAKLVQVYVSRLRKLLPDDVRIRTSSRAYALEVPKELIDATRFERLVGDSTSARQEGNNALAASLAVQALELWRGRAYGECAYAEFARGEAERLEGLRLVALGERISADLALGRHAEILGETVALAREHPLDERLQELAMLALYRCGRQSDGLDHYASVRKRLHDELGLEPAPALRELQQRILNQDPALDAPLGVHTRPGSTLDLPATPLVGRERELAALDSLLRERGARLLVLTGAGGTGKTRLALEAARSVASSFANGTVLVELAPLRDPALVAQTVAQALDVTETPDEALEETLVRSLSTLELLLLIDNAEHVREAAPLFARLVARAPRLTVLVTSRAVLHLSGELVFPVEPLGEDDALALLLQRAGQLAPAFRRTEGNERELREICRRVDGLPLAIELATARLRTLTPRLLLERLGKRLALLTSGPRDLPARQQTLRETIDWSVGLLSETERDVFARLAVFPAGATLEAAEAVCGADVDILAALVDDNVVRRSDALGEPRFGLLETVREYALTLLGDERPMTERALTVYLLALVEEAEATHTEDARWMARFDAELDNLRLALDAAAASATDSELELRLAGGLWRFWWTRGYLDEGLARLESALGRANGSSLGRVTALRSAAGIAWSRGDLELAETRATETLAVASEIGSPTDELAAHTILGILANQRKDFARARRHHEESLAIKESLGREPAVEKLNLGIVALDSGDNAAAVALFEEVLGIQRRNDNRSGIAFATLNLGLAHLRLGDAARAQESFQEARAGFAEVGFRAHVAHAMQGLAACAAASGSHHEAARLLGRAAAELGGSVYSEEDFPQLAADVEARARQAIGNEAFEAAYSDARAEPGHTGRG